MKYIVVILVAAFAVVAAPMASAEWVVDTQTDEIGVKWHHAKHPPVKPTKPLASHPELQSRFILSCGEKKHGGLIAAFGFDNAPPILVTNENGREVMETRLRLDDIVQFVKADVIYAEKEDSGVSLYHPAEHAKTGAIMWGSPKEIMIQAVWNDYADSYFRYKAGESGRRAISRILVACGYISKE